MWRPGVLPLLIVASMAGLFAACYGRAMVHGEQFALRDASHYYYPLHLRVQKEWEAGRWPLWAPEENAGMPLLGNPTAAVLYPGKLVFAALPYPLAARVYVMGHTLLAFATMFALLRHWGTSAAGSALAALAYAFGGPVLYQHCNVIFLVGAAWLPLGFLAVDRWVRLRRRAALAGLTVVLAMQVLGGDPETAYLTGVCAVGYATALARGRPWNVRRRHVAVLVLASGVAILAAAVFPGNSWAGPVVAAAWAGLGLLLLWRWAREGRQGDLVPVLAGLAAAAVVAAMLAGAQLLPAAEFIAQSGRAVEGAQDVYRFSLHPARLIELAWPNPFGTFRRGNRLWLGAISPGDLGGNTWVASLYAGALIAVLAPAAGLGRGGPAPWRAWLAAVAAVALLGSLGEYGSPVWLARRIPGAIEWLGAGSLRDGDGGVYWLLATALPGFGQFRYPSKLLTFAMLGISGLAGQGWDAVVSGDPRARRRVRVVAGSLLVVTLAALLASAAASEALAARLGALRLHTSVGLFDATGAVRETQLGLAQAAVVLAVALGLTSRAAGRWPLSASALAIAVTALDLALANAWVVKTVDQAVFEVKPEVLALIERAERDDPAPGPYRVHRVHYWAPPGWAETSSPDRIAEIVAWERSTLQPKYGITLGVHYTMSRSVTELHDYQSFFGAFRQASSPRAAAILGVAPGTPIVAYARRAFDLWGTRYFVLPYTADWRDMNRGFASFLDRTRRVYPPLDAFAGPDSRSHMRAWAAGHDYQVRRNLDEFPRAWVVHAARSLPMADGRTRPGLDPPMPEMLFSNDASWTDPARAVDDPRQFAWLESVDVPALAQHLDGGMPAPDERVRVVRHEPQRVELEAVLGRPGLVVLADAYYAGWQLEVDGRPAPHYRANRMMRGAAVAAGRHRLVYSYRPSSFRLGLALSAVGLAALVGLAAWARRGH